MDEFAAKVCAAIEDEMGKKVHIEVREVRKNNGVVLHGLMVSSEGQAVVPTVYLEKFLEAYESGTPFRAIVDRLVDISREEAAKPPIKMDFFRSFEEVRDGICYRLIRQEGNEGLLEEIPHIVFLDLAICFYYAYHGMELGDGTILIYNTHVEMWGTSVAELYSLAKRNTPRLFPWEYQGIGELMREMEGEDGKEPCLDPVEASFLDVPMKVLSNRKRIHGAACILYPGVLQKIAWREGDLFIIPSSLHEVILLPKAGAGVPKAEDLKEIVREVNRTQLAPEEVLSDSLYYYDSLREEILLA